VESKEAVAAAVPALSRAGFWRLLVAVREERGWRPLRQHATHCSALATELQYTTMYARLWLQSCLANDARRRASLLFQTSDAAQRRVTW